MMKNNRLYLLFILLIGHLFCLHTTPAFAQQKNIEVEDFTQKNTFRQASVRNVRWRKNGTQYSSLKENKIIISDIATGQKIDTLLDGKSLNPPIDIQDYAFSDDAQKILLLTNKTPIYRRSYTAIYYIYDTETQTLTPLGTDRQSYAVFSPKNNKVAYVSENNLFYYDLLSKKTLQITQDGVSGEIINASADWVYEEELEMTRAFAWSPSGEYIAFLRFDERHVKEYTLQYWAGKNSLYPYNYKYKYPKAGEENAKVSAHIYSLTSKETIAANVKADGGYLARLRWTKDPNDILSIERLNRLQNLREIYHIEGENGQSKRILQERSDTYIDISFCDDLHYLDNGKHFIYSSEKSGYKHFYLYTMEGKEVYAITSGDWEAERFVGLSQDKSPILYYTSTESGALQRHLYRIPVLGRKRLRRKLTTRLGYHFIRMNPSCSHYINYHSNRNAVESVSLHEASTGKRIKVLENNDAFKNTVTQYGLSEKEFFSFPSPNQDLLYGYLLKPKNFDPAKKYPVLLYQYSGPGSQSVHYRWGGSHYYFHQMLAQEGYLIVVVDTRGTGGRGSAFKKITYEQMGKYELEDLIETAKYLKALPFVDDQRIGIWGWSYGGYMSSLALFMANQHFSMAMAIAPVASWRFYDTIYTERYLQLPQENAHGYDAYSPLSHVDKLQGKYLLVHGTGDDNVHFQNAIALQEALIREEKHFTSFYYPNEAHALFGVRTHLYKMMRDFVKKNL